MVWIEIVEAQKGKKQLFRGRVSALLSSFDAPQLDGRQTPPLLVALFGRHPPAYWSLLSAPVRGQSRSKLWRLSLWVSSKPLPLAPSAVQSAWPLASLDPGTYECFGQRNQSPCLSVWQTKFWGFWDYGAVSKCWSRHGCPPRFYFGYLSLSSKVLYIKLYVRTYKSLYDSFHPIPPPSVRILKAFRERVSTFDKKQHVLQSSSTLSRALPGRPMLPSALTQARLGRNKLEQGCWMNLS